MGHRQHEIIQLLKSKKGEKLTCKEIHSELGDDTHITATQGSLKGLRKFGLIESRYFSNCRAYLYWIGEEVKQNGNV